MDVCGVCWHEKHAEDTARKGFISHWQGVFQAPPAAPPDPIQKDTAESLLRKIIELNDPAFVPAAFILAVMLERKRILKVKEQVQNEGRRVFIYEHPKTGDLFTVADPNLQLNLLDQVQKDVAHLLEHGLNPPESPNHPADAASAAPDEKANGHPSVPEEPESEQSAAQATV